MYTDNRDAYRRSFYEAWQKHLHQSPIEPLEAQLIHVMKSHPEYHYLFENPEALVKQAFEPEENPFLHMSLHLAIHEQVQMNRPSGISALYQEAIQKFPSAHEAEHALVTILGQHLWHAQQKGTSPDEATYLNTLRETLAQY